MFDGLIIVIDSFDFLCVTDRQLYKKTSGYNYHLALSINTHFHEVHPTLVTFIWALPRVFYEVFSELARVHVLFTTFVTC